MFISARSHSELALTAVVFCPELEMGGLLVKNKKRVTKAKDQDEIIMKLKQEKDRLRVHCLQTELSLQNDLHQAKQKLREGNREEAKTLLKKKIHHERELHRSNANLDKLDQITNELELARLALELTNFGERKVKRGRWRSIIKRKHKRQYPDSRKKMGKSVHEDIEIQVLDVFNQKERNKILEETRNGIVKQKKIDQLISGQLSKGDERAVEKELEAIMNGGYQLPDMDQDYQYAYKEGLKKPHESNDVTAITA